jgi:TPP-dependent 2-oxoacid decarboxylase
MGVRHVFGVPGDYILNFYSRLAQGPLQVINTCDEQGAGFAADAYARIHGLGVVCVTYNVGGFKVVNTTAQAYAEKSPVLVIAGAPGWQERQKYALLHHKVKEYEDQHQIFKHITVASTDLKDPARAFQEIDRVLSEIMRQKRPGYIELPRDMVCVVPESEASSLIPTKGDSDKKLLTETVDKITAIINKSSQPVIIAGVEVARYNLEAAIRKLAENANIPIVSTILGKSAVDETNPLFLGVYAGAIEDEAVRQYVESSDCILLLGVLLTDVNLGSNTAIMDLNKMISLSSDGCTIGNQSYTVPGIDLLPELIERKLFKHDRSLAPLSQVERLPAFYPTDAKITAEKLFQALNSFMDEHTILIADIGDSAMGSLSITIPKPNQFLCPAYYSSLGFAVPACIGVKAARPDLQPLVLVGDGAFQMTGMEISTASRYHMNPIIVVLNNEGFGTERPMIDGPFNDVAPWRYHLIPGIIGSGKGYLIRTEYEFVDAITEAKKSKELSIIEVILDKNDISPQLRRLCQRFAKVVKS